MKHLRGRGRRYFNLAIIAIYSSLHKLGRDESNYRYHRSAYEDPEKKTSPPQS
jgi:hypothetical protein